jgi:CheY-like chemotaxis protein
MAKILLVEDDTNLSEIYQARMEAEGYEVVAASDGESALALAAKEKPDLILSDVMMPKISGFEMLDILRNTDGLKHTKVIMLTALGQAEDQARAQSLGADKYLVKSQVTLEDIVSAAQELLGDGDQMLPTPAELAIPTITAASNADDDTPAVAEPVQAAPTGPMAATVPAAVTPEPVDEPAVQVVAMPVATAPQDESDESEEPAVAEVSAEPAEPITPLTEVFSQSEDTVEATPPATEEPAATPELPAEPQPVVPAPDIEIGTSAPAPIPTPALDETDVILEEPAAEPAVSADTEPAEEVDTPPSDPAPTEDPAPTPTSSEPVAAEATTPEEEPQPPVAPEVEEPEVPEPAGPEPETETTAPPVTAAAIDERVVANAIDKLLSKAPGATDNTAAISPTSSDEHPRNKVIAPIPHPPEPTLQELVAREEAKNIGSVAAPTVTAATGMPAPTPAPANPAASIDEADAAAVLAKAQATNTNPPKKDEFDPNSISL